MTVSNRVLHVVMVWALGWLLTVPTVAGIFDPPGWGDAVNTTRQKWTFQSQWESDNENPADDYWNPNGVPLGSAHGATDNGRWEPGELPRQGLMVLLSGPLVGPPNPETFVTFTVQNTGHDDRQKDYWLRIIYKGSIEARVSATVGGVYTPFDMTNSVVRDLGNDGWKERVFTGRLSECPPFENFRIRNSLAMGPTLIDEVEILTRCIPAPAGLVLLLLGSAMVYPRRR